MYSQMDKIHSCHSMQKKKWRLSEAVRQIMWLFCEDSLVNVKCLYKYLFEALRTSSLRSTVLQGCLSGHMLSVSWYYIKPQPWPRRATYGKWINNDGEDEWVQKGDDDEWWSGRRREVTYATKDGRRKNVLAYLHKVNLSRECCFKCIVSVPTLIVAVE